jgi:hypothetical protein
MTHGGRGRDALAQVARVGHAARQPCKPALHLCLEALSPGVDNVENEKKYIFLFFAQTDFVDI